MDEKLSMKMYKATGEDVGSWAYEVQGLEADLARVTAERDAALAEIVTLGDWTQIEARVQAARLAALRECYRLLSANGWCGATSGSGILELIDAEESKVSK